MLKEIMNDQLKRVDELKDKIPSTFKNEEIDYIFDLLKIIDNTINDAQSKNNNSSFSGEFRKQNEGLLKLAQYIFYYEGKKNFKELLKKWKWMTIGDMEHNLTQIFGGYLPSIKQQDKDNIDAARDEGNEHAHFDISFLIENGGNQIEDKTVEIFIQSTKSIIDMIEEGITNL